MTTMQITPEDLGHQRELGRRERDAEVLELQQRIEHLTNAGQFDPDGKDHHVDAFIDSYRRDPYARFVLNYFRLPAEAQNAFNPWMRRFKLFCTWKGGRWRCTGASRFGDVWLARDHTRDAGYDERVNVLECEKWGDAP